MKVLIADDHPLIAEGISSKFTNNDSIEIVHLAKTGSEVLDYVKKNPVDLVLMDLEMPEMNGIECSKLLRSQYPKIKIIILSMYEEPSLIEKFREIGIRGYLLKTSATENLLDAIQKVWSGGNYFSKDILSKVGDESVSKLSPVPSFQSSKLAKRLSKRERELIPLFSKGYTNVQIAEKLFISIRTIETHRANILRKTKTKNVAELVRFAFKNGLI